MQDKNRYQLHVQPRRIKTWDIRPARNTSAVRKITDKSADGPTIDVKSIHVGTDESRPQEHHSRHAPHARGDRKPRASLKRLSLMASAILLVGLTSFVGADVWLTNQHIKGEAVMGANDNRTSDAHSKYAEGSDETPITAATLDDYKVAANMPRFLEISKLGIKARVMPMGVNSDNSVQAPINTNDSGWYTGSARPGELGASFIDGHASGATRLGLFGNLDRLNKGDEIKIEKGDGSILTYSVVKVDIVPLDKVDMNQVLAPVAGSESGLNLMTCSGQYVAKNGTFNKRVIVYTKEIDS